MFRLTGFTTVFVTMGVKAYHPEILERWNQLPHQQALNQGAGGRDKEDRGWMQEKGHVGSSIPRKLMWQLSDSAL